MGGVLRSLLYLILIPVPIAAAEALLQSLRDKTHPLIIRTTPSTWEELRAELERQLVPILLKLWEPLGGLMPIPTIDLPDGVVSTSLVSQSEMVQFVTNTLNVWQGRLKVQIETFMKSGFLPVPTITFRRKDPKLSYTVNVTAPAVPTPTLSLSKRTVVLRKTVNLTAPGIPEPAITIIKEV